jgi:hypothetical protein
MKIRFLIFLAALGFLFFCAGAGFGDDGFLGFYSPQFQAGEGWTAGTNAPEGTVLNPASAAGKQRVTIDLSYMPLIGFGAAAGFGNFVNLGIALPSPVGVFDVTGRFANAAFTGLNWGIMGGLTFAFSKDLFPDFYVGAGLGVEIGSDWGVGADLGFLHLPGDIGFLKDFRWGVAIVHSVGDFERPGMAPRVHPGDRGAFLAGEDGRS